MIILHQGITIDTQEKAVGYVVVEGECFFIHDVRDGEKKQVAFVEPWLKGTNVEEISIVREDYGTAKQVGNWHYISDYFKMSAYMLREFHAAGAYYMEDIQGWGDYEYRHIYGFGEKSQQKMQIALLELGLEYSGKDYLNIAGDCTDGNP